MGSRSITPVIGIGILLGAALLVWSAALHLYVWHLYIRHIATIGPLFLVQGAVAIVTALILVSTRSPLVALFGALVLTSTAIGLLLSAWVGLFGYKERLAAPYAGMSLWVEFIGSAVLLVVAGLSARRAGQN